MTFGYVERCLAELINNQTQVDYIMQYLKDNRETTISNEVKRIYKKKN